MADVLKSYISWAIEYKLSVVDCNIPKFLTGISETDGHAELEAGKITRATEELAVYIWENYIEVSAASRVILMGVGDAYRAVLQVLNTRNWDNIQQFAGAVGFIDASQPIFPVSESFMTDFAKTYYRVRCTAFSLEPELTLPCSARCSSSRPPIPFGTRTATARRVRSSDA